MLKTAHSLVTEGRETHWNEPKTVSLLAGFHSPLCRLLKRPPVVWSPQTLHATVLSCQARCIDREMVAWLLWGNKLLSDWFWGCYYKPGQKSLTRKVTWPSEGIYQSFVTLVMLSKCLLIINLYPYIFAALNHDQRSFFLQWEVSHNWPKYLILVTECSD